MTNKVFCPENLVQQNAQMMNLVVINTDEYDAILREQFAQQL